MPIFSGPKWDLDTTLRLFIMKAGITAIDVQIDLYSDWKELMLSNDALRAYPPALRTVGGDTIDETRDLGGTYFLINDYKLRPDEVDHTLTITGNLFADPAANGKVVPTLGGFTVLVDSVVSQNVETQFATVDQIALNPIVYIDSVNGNDSNGGTSTSKVQTITRARAIADANNVSTFNLSGTITLDDDYQEFEFIGHGSELNNRVNFAGFDVTDSSFVNMRLSGTVTGRFMAKECQLQSPTGINGVFRNCGLTGTVTVGGGDGAIFAHCYSEVPGDATPTMSVDGVTDLNIRNYSGGINLTNMHDPTTVSVGLDPGHLILDATCDGGEVLVRGHGHLTNNADEGASPTIRIVKRGLLDGLDLTEIKQMITGDADTSGDDTTVTIWDEGGRTGNIKQLEYTISADKRQRTRTL
jgi:hypothetical protein